MKRTEEYRNKWEQLKLERQRTVEAKWRDIAEYFCPERGKFDTVEGSPDTSQAKRGSKIIDSTGQDALETATNGMHSGLTPPSRPWFRLAFSDDSLNDVSAAKDWLQRLQDLLYSTFRRSNWYPSVRSLYAEVIAFATGCMYMEADPRTVVRYRSFTAGECWFGQNYLGKVDTVYRRIMMTAQQMVTRFGENKCSRAVNDASKNTPYQAWEVVHLVQPRKNYDPTKLDKLSMPYESVFCDASEDFNILAESGYKKFPYLVPRYLTVGNDVYGSASPGWKKLPDNKQLQDMEESKIRTIHKLVEPPMMAPTGLKGQPIRSGPKGITYYDGQADQLKPLYQVQGRVNELTEEMQEVRQRILKGFYVDIFMMIEQMQGNVTATEVLQRVEEKKLQLGPFVESQEDDVLDPALEFAIEEIIAQSKIEPPPEEVMGEDYKIEYRGPLAMAFKLAEATAIDQTLSFTGNAAAINPEIIDNLDFDEAFRERANLVGLPLKVLRGIDVVAQIRKQRAEQQAQQQQMQQAAAMVQGAQQLSQTSTDPQNPNALTDITKAIAQQAGGGMQQ